MSDDKRCECGGRFVWDWRTVGMVFACVRVCIRCGYVEGAVKREAVRHG